MLHFISFVLLRAHKHLPPSASGSWLHEARGGKDHEVEEVKEDEEGWVAGQMWLT